MSQFWVPSTAGTPSVPTQVTVDVGGPAIPVANNLNLYGRDTTVNNDNGIRTNNDPSGGETIYVELTNRVTGQVTTTNATPTILSSFALSATPGCYTIDGTVTGFNASGSNGIGIFFAAAVKSTGAVATVIGVSNTSEFKDNAAWDITVTASGNNLVVTAIGSATTLNWDVSYTYRFVG